MRGYEIAENAGESLQTELRIPMRGYEAGLPMGYAYARGVTNPHAGL